MRAPSPHVGVEAEKETPSAVVDELKAQLLELEARGRSLEFELQVSSRELEGLRSSLVEKEKLLETSKAEALSQQGDLESALEIANEEKSSLKAELTKRESIIKALETKILKLNEASINQNELDQLSEQVSEKNDQIIALQSKIDDLEGLCTEQESR